MKKSIVAAFTLAILAAGFTGTAWYTGKKAEEEYKNYLAKINQKMAKEAELTGVLVELKNIQFDRGIFSSKYSYDTSIQVRGIDWAIPFEGNLYHGPLPLNQLVKFNFKPMIFSSDAQLVKNDKTKAIFELTQSSSPVVGEVNMSYNQQLTGYALFKGGKGTWDGVSADWKDIRLTFNTDINGVGKIDTLVDKLVVSIPTVYLGSISQRVAVMDVELNKLNVHSDFTKTKFNGLYSGSLKGQVDNLKYIYYSAPKLPLGNFEVKNLTFDYIGKLEKDFFDVKFKFDSDSFINDKHLAKLKLDSELNHIAAKELTELNNVDISEGDAERLTLSLLQKKPKLAIKPLIVSNNKGKIEANLLLELVENADFDKVPKALSNVFKQLELDVDGKEDVLTQILFVLLQAEGASEQDAEQMAKWGRSFWLDDAISQGILVKKEDSLSLKLALEKEGLRLNGTLIPPELIDMLLFK